MHRRTLDIPRAPIRSPNRPRALGLLIVVVSLVWLRSWCPSICMAADKTPTRTRRYDEGPLRIEEFQGKPDEKSGGQAYTACTVEYSFTYTVRPTNGNFTATLASFKSFAVFLPDESWWTNHATPKLLDHEQGHFDIAEAAARRLEYTFLTGKPRQLSATSKTSDRAVKALQRKLQTIMKVANEQAIKDSSEYDSLTLNGVHLGKQAEYRRVQKATLKRLAEKIADAKKQGNERIVR